MTESLLRLILDKHPILQTIPVVYDMDFAHTQPLLTMTIGATITISTEDMTFTITED